MSGVPLNIGDKHTLAISLLIWRYAKHVLRHKGQVPTNESCERASRALEIAGKLGIEHEYVAAMMAYPLLTVHIDEIE